MELIILVVFVLGYISITLEHTFKVDKLIPAITMMAILWAIVSIAHMPVFEINPELKQLEESYVKGVLVHHLGKTAEILIFLIGAMTIVEIIDYFNGFYTFKKLIKTKSRARLLWIFGVLAFFLSAIIDNLTATIVLVTILQKIVRDKKLRLWMAGMVVIAANAGGAWSPIGDVTTTMLWISDKVTVMGLIINVGIPSIVCMIIPFLIASILPVFHGRIRDNEKDEFQTHAKGTAILIIGLSAIVFVPFFKIITHLPPYIGMMLSLAIVATCGEIYSRRHISLTKPSSDHNAHETPSPLHHSLTKIEFPSILFFLGILMAVAALESLGMLYTFAKDLKVAIPNSDAVVGLLGILSAIIDNVPLVAAGIGMFDYPMDHQFWHLMAYAAGTGGSILIIGSAAGVVAMGMEKINFFWYLSQIGWIALIGFLSGFFAFIFMRDVVF
ncbi:MAG: sodium:proton antiporter NhaD [Flavobacteriaceae bacterium]|nr:sodium:proton antiporter NhaD [Flavobacteriaceae bacterium]MCY4268127.1 sodium:proton antiporter NhaD [Flavobacteriaceae bacterium]MCY4299842.1 sodium:proton antiporter NhaD [Flavobacteriaceae bacterium]